MNFRTNSIFFIDENTGWAAVTAVGDNPNEPFNGEIYLTKDGGRSWRAGVIEGAETLNKRFGKWSLTDIVGFQSGKGYAAVAGIILVSNNSGETWKIADVEPIKYFKLGYIDENFVWALATGGYREFLLTSDGGKKWEQVPLPDDRRETVQFLTYIDKKNCASRI